MEDLNDMDTSGTELQIYDDRFELYLYWFVLVTLVNNVLLM